MWEESVAFLREHPGEFLDSFLVPKLQQELGRLIRENGSAREISKIFLWLELLARGSREVIERTQGILEESFEFLKIIRRRQ